MWANYLRKPLPYIPGFQVPNVRFVVQFPPPTRRGPALGSEPFRSEGSIPQFTLGERLKIRPRTNVHTHLGNG